MNGQVLVAVFVNHVLMKPNTAHCYKSTSTKLKRIERIRVKNSHILFMYFSTHLTQPNQAMTCWTKPCIRPLPGPPQGQGQEQGLGLVLWAAAEVVAAVGAGAGAGESCSLPLHPPVKAAWAGAS